MIGVEGLKLMDLWGGECGATHHCFCGNAELGMLLGRNVQSWAEGWKDCWLQAFESVDLRSFWRTRL